MQVRQLRRSDLKVAIGLLRQLGYDVPSTELANRIDRVLANDANFAAVADEGGSICGLVHAYERPALERPCEVVVQSLVVESEGRNSGAGKLLMSAVESWAASRGLKRVVLHTRIDRDSARAFYERIGYSKAATSHLMSKLIDTA